ncbi:hypothetical protein THRCLA_21943 [Thraustotheca clavata]|uniref:Uncharacterized protein n=1 Tax=Thraustotheca clavata TaxID=74557 RepID=A0A1V9ZHA5_9STRA|nr:hypothetical protein THRCLA_21943 [Thraustotheca clavata]
MPVRRNPTDRWLNAQEFFGWVYVMCSITISGYAIGLCAAYMENGLFWPLFSAENTFEALSNIMNQKLSVSFDSNFTLLDPARSVWQPSHFGVSPAYPRLILYQELTTLSDAINGLRRLKPAQVSFMITPYCWVDMQQRWVIAHTSIRLQRCQQRDPDNAAVYLESVLRNIDMDAWLAVSGGSFLTKIARTIQTTKGGREWIDGILDNTLVSIDEEIKYWKQYQLQRFTLQYANRVQIGIIETIAIINAFGIEHQLPIKSVLATNRGAAWTSSYMYQGLQNDFGSIWANESLVRNGNIDAELLVIQELEAYDVGYPLNAINQLIHDKIGPLDSIDLRWIFVPNNLASAVNEFNQLIMTCLLSSTQFYMTFSAISPVILYNVPYIWQDSKLRFLSGNPMCSNGAPMPFVQSAFGFDDACGTQTPTALKTTPFNILFALHMIRGDTRDICPQLPSQQQLCESILQLLLSAYVPLFANASIVVPNITNLELSKVQFVLNGSDYSIQRIKLLGERYDFFGWANVYDWAMNHREAISFEGDYQTLNLLSYIYTPMELPKIGVKTNTNVGMYLWYSSAVVTVVLGAVAFLSSILWVIYKPKLGTTHWLLFNRIASSVWLNRTILFIRSGTTIIVLATCPIYQFSAQPYLTSLCWEPRDFLKSMVLAGETTWITYIALEVLHPITLEYTTAAARYSSFLAWLAVLIIDQVSPVQLEESYYRKCSTENMDYQLYCTCGTIKIGSVNRLILIGCLQLVAVAFGIFLSTCFYSSNKVAPRLKPSLLLQGSVHAYINATEHELMNRATAAMSGLFLVKSKDGKEGVFDVNRWTFLSLDVVEHGFTFLSRRTSLVGSLQSSAFGTNLIQPCLPCSVQQPHYSRQLLLCERKYYLVLLGFFYMVFTITSNVLYFTVVLANLANDYGWAGFNSTGMQVFLANTFNKHLLLVPSTHDLTLLPLDENTIGDWTQLYNDSSATITWSEGSARRQLYGQPNQLSQVITDIRNMNPCNLPWVSTQYCWLDFNRTWAMAATTARQYRCDHHMYINGAVYLESSVRNMNDWVAFESCWGHSFDLGFVQHIQSSLDGQIWLRDVRTNTNSIGEEVAYWHRHQITKFVLQWQNYKTLGMTDVIQIQSALGLLYPLLLSQSSGSFHIRQQTSFKLYWSLASDFWAIGTNKTGVGGLSLVSSSPRFAFMNKTRLELLYENTTMVSPLNDGFVIFEETVGPFGVVDSYYINCPSSMLKMFRLSMASLVNLTVVNATAQDAFFNLSPAIVGEVPTYLLYNKSIDFCGGNILCGNDVVPWNPFNGLYNGFGVNNFCNSVFAESIQPVVEQLLIAFLALKSQRNLTIYDIAAICRLDINQPQDCAAKYWTALDYLQQYYSIQSLQTIQPFVSQAFEDVQDLNVSFVQYIVNDGDTKPTLHQIPILDPNDPPWQFYGWCLLYEWVFGAREVVQFSGDLGNITVLSAVSPKMSRSSDSNEIPRSFSFLCLYCVQVVTITLTVVSFFIALSTIGHRGNIEPLNLFCINRVVGLVWVGRPIVFLRSLTAVWLLNTSQLSLVLVNRVTVVDSPQTAWYRTLLTSSELTWFVYVLNDIGSCITGQYTYSYSYLSSNLTWILTGVWTIVFPQQYSAIIERKCSAVDVDFEIICSSGVVAVGGPSRLIKSLILVFVCVICCYLYERRGNVHVATQFTAPLLLNAQGYYMLSFKDWELNGLYYIDKTSAIMAGILCLELKDQVYILDIKAWRFLSVSTETIRPQHILAANSKFTHAIPLDL